ncbi:unnamed protein product [Cercospora beticola]|nr:unnamed protein product [Cercospora beticola]
MPPELDQVVWLKDDEIIHTLDVGSAAGFLLPASACGRQPDLYAQQRLHESSAAKSRMSDANDYAGYMSGLRAERLAVGERLQYVRESPRKAQCYCFEDDYCWTATPSEHISLIFFFTRVHRARRGRRIKST